MHKEHRFTRGLAALAAVAVLLLTGATAIPASAATPTPPPPASANAGVSPNAGVFQDPPPNLPLPVETTPRVPGVTYKYPVSVPSTSKLTPQGGAVAAADYYTWYVTWITWNWVTNAGVNDWFLVDTNVYGSRRVIQFRLSGGTDNTTELDVTGYVNGGVGGSGVYRPNATNWYSPTATYMPWALKSQTGSVNMLNWRNALWPTNQAGVYANY